MYESKGTARDRLGIKTNYTKGHSTQFFRLRHMVGSQFSRCRKCGSDYMRASIDGYCQPCLQLVEYRAREGSDGLAAITNGGLESQNA